VEPFLRALIWNQILQRRRAFGYVISGFWMHIGNLQALALAEQVLKQVEHG